MENKTLISIILVVIVIALIIIGWGATRPNNPPADLLTASTSPISSIDIATSSVPTASSSQVISNNPPTGSGQINKKMSPLVTLETSLGTIQFETYNQDAPNTVANFVKLAEKGFYNGVIFHRVIKGFMIQGGDPTGTGTGGPGYQFADELNSATPSYKAGYKKGVVAMANAGPNTNGSQFFIMHEDYALPNAYTIFGKVVKGQDIVDKIANVKVDANDKPLTPVVIKNVTVAK
ncbi:MAG: peptidylprolyl isomerase [Candidatus Vogelbacteria bacterium]|nr:peptidylprolyl isomerase [Candidatus Vogelbacteria bacterium]